MISARLDILSHASHARRCVPSSVIIPTALAGCRDSPRRDRLRAARRSPTLRAIDT